MSAFTESELGYLRGERSLACLITVGEDGKPYIAPVGWTYNAAHDAIDISGYSLEWTRKYDDVRRTGQAAVVIGDPVGTKAWRPRGVEVRGRAEAISPPTPLVRIHPEQIVSWGI
jgi:pyridoxamine 5'-phosphate oxidase family protein